MRISRSTAVRCSVTSPPFPGATLVTLDDMLEAEQVRAPETFEELPQLRQPFRSGLVEAAGAVAAHGHQPRAFEDLKMLRHGRPGDLELRRDRTCRQLLVTHQF